MENKVYRKVQVWHNDFDEPKEGFFHQWANDCTVQESENKNIGVGNYTVGIVELLDRDVRTFLPNMIKFLDRPNDN